MRIHGKDAITGSYDREKFVESVYEDAKSVLSLSKPTIHIHHDEL